MKGINKASLVLSKGLEVIHWIGAMFMLAVLGSSFVAKDWLGAVLSKILPQLGVSISTYGFEVMAINADGTVNMATITMFSIGATIILALMAMVFRNIYLILKTSNGQTWFSNGITPFQKNIVRMIREIGIFFIAVPVIGLMMSIIFRLLVGVDVVEISVRLGGFITGILVLSLSQIFSYGTELQNDIDGLL